MTKHYSTRLWAARIILALTGLLYAWLAYRFISDPTTITLYGLFRPDMNVPDGASIVRVAIGGPFLAVALTALIGLSDSSRFRPAACFVTLMSATYVAVRLYAISEDGTGGKNIGELMNEATGLAMALAALLLYPKK